jgi:hypothetical protein
MDSLKLTAEQEAQIVMAMKANKPYLIAIEDWVQKSKDGYIEFRVEVRQGRVEKMTKYSGDYWMREKEQPVTKKPF